MRWSRFFRRKHWDQERARELETHLEIETDENIARGMSPEQARQAARRKLGNSTLIREEIYHMNSIRFFETVWQDVRYAVRTLARSRAFTFVVIASLALGIGANTAIFSLIDAALLKMLPVRNPEQLVEFKHVNPGFGAYNSFAYPAFKEFRDHNRVFSGVLAFLNLMFNMDVEVNGHGGVAKGQVVSGDYFSTLGVHAIIGRTIEPRDEKSANPVAVITYNYWRKRFALDPAVVGKNILINNSPFTIIGVTPPEFFGLQPGKPIDVSAPLTTIAQINPGMAMAGTREDVLTAPFSSWLSIMGRLKPGVTKEKASANLQPIFRQAMREAVVGEAGMPFDSPALGRILLASKLRLDSGGQGLAALRQKYSKPLWILMAITGLLLLVACANVANLMLARANARQKEIMVRLTVGAGRLRLIRQFLTESVLLALCGGVLGLIAAFWACRSLLVLMSHAGAPLSLSVQPDIRVLLFTLLVSVGTALLFGLAPAWRAARLKIECTRSHGKSGSRSRLGKALIVLQIAVSLVLMIEAGLLVRSLENLKDFYPGFNKENVLLFSVDPGTIGYNGDQVIPVDKRLLDRINRIPGVRSATFSFFSPLSTHGHTRPKIDGPTPQSVKATDSVGINEVGPNYFTTLQTPVLSGRDFTDADQAGAPNVAIINETMAHDYFGDTNPIGRNVSVPAWRDSNWRTIVGVMKDAKTSDLRESPVPMLYLPLFQSVEGAVTFEVRTAIDPHSAVRAILHAVKATDSRLPVSDVKTLTEQADQSLIQERLVASLSSLFGVLALLLAAVGLYGLMTYAVNRRTAEIGIRMALGATRIQIAGMILGETLRLVVIGLLIGIPAGMAASRLIASELYGVKPDDALAIILPSAVMAAIAALAAWLPARRASRVDPMTALRHE